MSAIHSNIEWLLLCFIEKLRNLLFSAFILDGNIDGDILLLDLLYWNETEDIKRMQNTWNQNTFSGMYNVYFCVILLGHLCYYEVKIFFSLYCHIQNTPNN